VRVQDPTDEELMEQVQAGNERAFTALFERHRAPLYGFVLRMTREEAAAEDCFQEAFLSVHRAKLTWSRAAGSFRSWLFRIATNAVRDHQRRLVRRPLLLLEEELPLPVRDFPEERLMLERALAQLAPHLREAFLLGAMHGLDHAELAEALDISPDNARARVSRARIQLRQILGTA
jgi:RNA polymerase sigma-70 factor (ECF subfamily)